MTPNRAGREGSETTMTTYRRFWRTGGWAALWAVGSLATAACSDLLDVELPGKVVTEQLDDPSLANALASGVVSTFECGWTHFVAGTNALSDQVLSTSGQGNTNTWGLRTVLENNINLTDNCDAAVGGYTFLAPLQATRVLADNAFTRIDGFPDARVPNKALLKAQVKTYAAYATIPLGEAFCSMAFDQGPVITPAQALQDAETRLTEAFNLATTANSADLRNMALVGRARVRLDLGNFAGARADAEQVTAGYVKNATRGATDRHRWNLLYEFQNNEVTQSLRHTTIAPAFRDVRWEGVADPRVKVTATTLLAGDNLTPLFRHAKALSRSDPVLIASFREARLIVAEAAARSGDLPTARTVINALHTAANIPGYDLGDTATQNEVIAQVIEERARELFMEVGARYNDHLRFRSTAFKIPFRGEAGSVHPNGVDQRNQQYGSTTCVPLAAAETLGR
jgi:hypothetical protein